MTPLGAAIASTRSSNVRSSEPRPPKRAGGRARRPKGGKPASKSDAYHHGDLREALLQAAERLLDREGIQSLTLRAAAREAGVSHAAPKHHFRDVAGLLTELAIVGFDRFGEFLSSDVRDNMSPREKLRAIAHGYVAFAEAHSALFLLMFRSERLDMTRPALREAARSGLDVLASAFGGSNGESDHDELTLAMAGQLARAWSLVHGFSVLLIDGRWKPLLSRLPGADADDLLEAMLGGAEAR
ncbi:MAG TPA: WHG domain-containing protein [Roseiarcus sp.]|nr:WHG domain-containing protein [Roseiarcus sp.]